MVWLWWVKCYKVTHYVGPLLWPLHYSSGKTAQTMHKVAKWLGRASSELCCIFCSQKSAVIVTTCKNSCLYNIFVACIWCTRNASCCKLFNSTQYWMSWFSFIISGPAQQGQGTGRKTDDKQESARFIFLSARHLHRAGVANFIPQLMHESYFVLCGDHYWKHMLLTLKPTFYNQDVL